MRFFRIVKLIYKNLCLAVKDERRKCQQRRAHDLFLNLRKEFEDAN